ncbi:hypothetical protein M378DRAFT_27688 [Amanita muscaria Koide BX008]|uniref:Uncharacterized protein n=1 Tax=Amanita muscaria (strain Koide BX008) TaxID=946122 RepID=A0A0C2SVR3_AMAMK|nr:hypothetical protein M378DRAFT_27688 [Amanita muscaria Koide BX008]
MPQDSLAPPLPTIENSFSPAAESEAKEAKAPVEEAAEPKPVALSKTPTRKHSTVAAKLQHLQLRLGPQRWRRRQPSCLLLPPLEAPIHLGTRDSVIRHVYLFTYQEERKSRQEGSPERKFAGRFEDPSRAHVGLQRDLGMVRAFAHDVERKHRYPLFLS